MKTSQLVYFVAVAETGSLSMAAKKLSITPPALSIAIANLEKELGVQLFTREKNRITLNEYGALYLHHVKYVLECLDRAKAEIQRMSPPADTEVTL